MAEIPVGVATIPGGLNNEDNPPVPIEVQANPYANGNISIINHATW